MTARSEMRGPRPPDRSRPQVLYRLRDSAGRLLYVGRTHNFSGRMAQHRRENHHWWGAVAAIETEEFPDFASADAAEKSAIASERPAMNVMHAAEQAEWQAEGWQRATVAVDPMRWALALRTAQARGESIHAVLRDAIAEYVAVNGRALAER